MYRTLLISALSIGALASAQEIRTTPSTPVAQANMYAREIPTEYVGVVPQRVDGQGYSRGWGWDAVAFAAITSGKNDYYSPNMFGVELTGSYYFTPKQALTLSFGGAYGSKGNESWYDRHTNANFTTYDYSRTDLFLMAGYRFSQPIGKYVRFTIGAKAGLDLQYFGLNDVERYRWNGTEFEDDADANSLRAGFGYAGYAELGIAIDTNSFITVGYQFHGATTHPGLRSYPMDKEVRTKAMLWHEIRVGINVRF